MTGARRLVRAAVAIVSALAASPAAAQAIPDPSPAPLWGTNGPVHALARVGDTLFVGGEFDIVGAPSGGLAVIEAADATAVVVPSAGIGTVNRLTTDGAGGWYTAQLAGGIQGATVRHVRADGSPDPAWIPPTFGPSSYLLGLYAAGGRVYVTGGFSTVNDQQRFGAAAFDGATGALLPGRS